MKKAVILIGIIFVLCSCGSQKAQVNNIACSERTALISEGAILIDVRSEVEFKSNHLDGAINLNYETIDKTIEEKVSDKDTKIIVYCQSGNRSATAAQKLINLGYTNVYDMGGITKCND